MGFLRGKKFTEVRESCQTDVPIGTTFDTIMCNYAATVPGA